MTKTYSISTVATRFGCTHRALRFYEGKGLVSPERVGWERRYSDKDCEDIAVIVRTRAAGLSLDDARVLLELRGAKRAAAFETLLRQRRADLRDALDRVEQMLESDAVRAA